MVTCWGVCCCSRSTVDVCRIIFRIELVATQGNQMNISELMVLVPRCNYDTSTPCTSTLSQLVCQPFPWRWSHWSTWGPPIGRRSRRSGRASLHRAWEVFIPSAEAEATVGSPEERPENVDPFSYWPFQRQTSNDVQPIGGDRTQTRSKVLRQQSRERQRPHVQM